MANTIIWPIANPLPAYIAGQTVDPRYNTNDFLDWKFSETILDWEEKVDWFQPFQKTDHIKLQLQSNYGPINLCLYTLCGDLIDTIPFNQVIQNANDPLLFIYEVDCDLSLYEEGKYTPKVEFGSPVNFTLELEDIELSENCENTLLLEYSHPTYREDMIFETGIQPQLRIPATNIYDKTATKTTSWEDQPLDYETIRSVPYRLWKLSIGGTYGIPNPTADIIAEVSGCKTFLINGKYFSRAGEMESSDKEDYPLRGWTLDLREKRNRRAKIYVNNAILNAQLSVMINVDSKGFGADTGGNETVITDVQ